MKTLRTIPCHVERFLDGIYESAPEELVFWLISLRCAGRIVPPRHDWRDFSKIVSDYWGMRSGDRQDIAKQLERARSVPCSTNIAEFYKHLQTLFENPYLDEEQLHAIGAHANANRNTLAIELGRTFDWFGGLEHLGLIRNGPASRLEMPPCDESPLHAIVLALCIRAWYNQCCAWPAARLALDILNSPGATFGSVLQLDGFVVCSGRVEEPSLSVDLCPQDSAASIEVPRLGTGDLAITITIPDWLDSSICSLLRSKLGVDLHGACVPSITYGHPVHIALPEMDDGEISPLSVLFEETPGHGGDNLAKLYVRADPNEGEQYICNFPLPRNGQCDIEFSLSWKDGWLGGDRQRTQYRIRVSQGAWALGTTWPVPAFKPYQLDLAKTASGRLGTRDVSILKLFVEFGGSWSPDPGGMLRVAAHGFMDKFLGLFDGYTASAMDIRERFSGVIGELGSINSDSYQALCNYLGSLPTVVETAFSQYRTRQPNFRGLPLGSLRAVRGELELDLGQLAEKAPPAPTLRPSDPRQKADEVLHQLRSVRRDHGLICPSHVNYCEGYAFWPLAILLMRGAS